MLCHAKFCILGFVGFCETLSFLEDVGYVEDVSGFLGVSKCCVIKVWITHFSDVCEILHF